MSHRGFFGIGIENGKTEANLGTLWRSAANFGASFLFTIGNRYTHEVTDTTKAWKHTPLYYYYDVDDFLENLPKGVCLVGLEIEAEVCRPLVDYCHPERAVYILGGEDCGLSNQMMINCDHIIYIPSARCLNVAVAGSICLYDRVAKCSKIG